MKSAFFAVGLLLLASAARTEMSANEFLKTYDAASAMGEGSYYRPYH